MRCKGKNWKGELCKKHTIHPSGYCEFHREQERINKALQDVKKGSVYSTSQVKEMLFTKQPPQEDKR